MVGPARVAPRCLSGNEFGDPEQLGHDLSRLVGLVSLDISRCRLRRLPPLKGLGGLTRLDARENALTSSAGLLRCTGHESGRARVPPRCSMRLVGEHRRGQMCRPEAGFAPEHRQRFATIRRRLSGTELYLPSSLSILVSSCLQPDNMPRVLCSELVSGGLAMFRTRRLCRFPLRAFGFPAPFFLGEGASTDDRVCSSGALAQSLYQ